MREYVKDGTVKAFALWNPDDLGYLAAYAAKALVDGDITGEEGDTFNAGKLGEFTVGADATVLLGDPFVFNKEQHRPVQLLTSGAGRRAPRPPAGHRRPTLPPRRTETDAARLLPAPGPAGPARRSTASATPRSGRTCSRRWRDTGWHNYSLFLRDDGLLIGYLETPSTSRRPRPGMARDRGQRPLAGRDGRVLRGPRRRAHPTQGFLALEEVFHLEDQLAARPDEPHEK